MEANGRFVEDIEGADQPRSELIRQRDSLSFTAGERLRLSVECQVPKTDALEKAELCLELSKYVSCNVLLERTKRQGFHPISKALHCSFHRLMDVVPNDLDEESLRFEAAAMAIGAIERRAVAAQKDTDMQFVALTFEVCKEIVDSVERFGALPDEALMIRGQRLEGCLDIDTLFFHRGQHLLLPPGRAGFTPGLHGSLGKRLGRVGDHPLLVVSQHIAEAFAFGTGPERMVERKENRPQRLESPSASLAEKLCAVRLSPMVDDVDRTAAFAFVKCCFHSFD